jgi:hypothetical protein
MTLPAFATVDQFADRLPGGLALGDLSRALAALEDASALIRVEAGKDWAGGDDGDELDFGDLAQRHQDAITTVCISVARRAFTNPAGVNSQTAGPFSSDFADASSDVYLKASERAVVKRAAGLTGLISIATTREDPIGSSDLGTLGNDGVIYAPTTTGQDIPFLNDGELLP